MENFGGFVKLTSGPAGIKISLIQLTLVTGFGRAFSGSGI